MFWCHDPSTFWKGVMWIWPFLLTQPLSISIRLDRRSTYVLTMLWDYVFGQLYVLHVPTRFLSMFPWHPSRFYCSLGTLPSRSPRLYHALTVSSVCKLSSYCTIHTFYIPKLLNELLPSVCICNFINICAKREVCRPKCLSLSFFFFAKEEGCAFITARI